MSVPTLATGRVRPGPLHRDPPFRVTEFFGTRQAWLVIAAGIVATLAFAAAIAGGALPLTWDEPIQRFVEDHRTETLDAFFLTMSRLGSTVVVLSLGAVLAVLVWPRCRAVSVAIVVATLARPPIEATLKTLVDRDRPDFERLVDGTGPSFPSGHPMAAVVLYGFIPVVVALYTHRRRIIAAAWIVSTLLVAGIAASRVYLGVHWFSDVTASLLLAAFLLLAIEWLVERGHRIHECRDLSREVDNEFDAVTIDRALDAELERDLYELESELTT